MSNEMNDAWALPPKEMGKFELLPKGKYNAHVDLAQHTFAKSSGNDMVKLAFSILDGPFKGRKIFDNRPLTPKTIPWFKGELKRLDIEVNSPDQLPFALEALLGKEVELYVSVQEAQGAYEAKNRASINGLAKADNNPTEPVADDIGF